jgi:sulfur dioxygenase
MSISSLVEVDKNISICGEIKNQNDLATITSSYKSLIYLNPDTDGDNGCYGEGFNVIKEAMGVNAFQIPINVTKQPFTPFNSITGYSLYLELQNTIDKCEKPLLLLCKSNRRAGAVYSLYKGIQEKKSEQQLLDDSHSLQLSFPSTAPLFDWVKNCHTIGTSSPILRRQFFENTSSTYTYLLVCSKTMEGILIDPVLETVERDAQIIKEMGVTLKYLLNTHVHADHITGSGKLKNIFTECLSIISEKSNASSDIKVNDGDKIEFGNRYVTVLATPGHTEECQSFVLDDLSSVYTGDALLVRGCGRTDFQGGSASDLYESIHQKIFTLPGNCIVYPAHCYKGNTQSTVLEEKLYNPRLSKGKDEFIEIMNNLNLPRPAKMDDAVPANMKCGIY